MNAYLISHLGLGDNLYMIGAARYLLKYYSTIYFVCKKKYYDNVKLFFNGNKNIIIIPVDRISLHKDNVQKILTPDVYKNNDVILCGSFKNIFKTKITNKNLLNRIRQENKYTIDHDTLTSSNYYFIENFYKDIKLELNIFYDYFNLPSFIESKNYYNLLSDYKNIIFIHSQSSDNVLKFDKLFQLNFGKCDTIMVCANHNVYESTKDLSKFQHKKYEICKKLVNIPLVYYKDIIQKCQEIYITDSCFTGIVLPYLKTNKLNAKIVRIIRRRSNIEL